MGFGSCQYGNVFDITKKNINKVLGKNKVDDFSKVIKIKFKFCPEIGFDEAKIKILKLNLEICNTELLEKIGFDNILSSDQSNKSLMIINSKLQELEIQDKNMEDNLNEIYKYIEPLIKVNSIQELIGYIKDSGWDLWGCIGTITPFFGLEISEDGSDDVIAAYGILYLIWKYNIDNWDKIFKGFST